MYLIKDKVILIYESSYVCIIGTVIALSLLILRKKWIKRRVCVEMSIRHIINIKVKYWIIVLCLYLGSFVGL